MSTPPASGLQNPALDDRSLSALAQGMVGSEVLRIAGQVRAAIASGRDILNLTVGDFDSKEFPVPASLVAGIQRALADGHTNYPPSNGMPELRKSVAAFYARELRLEVPVESVVVAGGARPLIYATYRTLVDPGESVVFPVPSWNNNHYAQLCGAKPVPLTVTRSHGFHPTPDQISAELPTARLIALCSPLNPTGTPIDPAVLTAICERIVAENARRERSGDRPVFLMFDQVYWATAFGEEAPPTPATLVPEVGPYTILIDAISKSLAATGLRVGWAVAHPAVSQRLSDLLGHIGAWAPKPEQVATAAFLADAQAFTAARHDMERRLRERLQLLHDGILRLRAQGHPIDAVEPQGTLYLSARIELPARIAGRDLRTNEEVRRLLLDEAGLAVVPFQAFALPDEGGWFRLSVGAVSMDGIERGLERLGRLLAS